MPEVKVNEEVTDPYCTHANYAKMLEDERTIKANNLMNLANMVFMRMDKIKGKTADCVDLSADESTAKQPQMVCLTITLSVPK